MEYNWDEIYTSRTDAELIRIFNGEDIIQSSKARISAARILLDRGYEREKLLTIKKKYIENLNFEINKITKTDKEKEKRKNLISTTIISIFWFIIFYLILRPNFVADSILEFKQILFLISVFVMVISTIIGIKKFNKKHIKELEEDLMTKQKIKDRLNQELQI